MRGGEELGDLVGVPGKVGDGRAELVTRGEGSDSRALPQLTWDNSGRHLLLKTLPPTLSRLASCRALDIPG